MAGERDRLGEKIKATGNAAANQWASKRDSELLAAMNRKARERAAQERKEGRKPRAFNRILCPIDFGKNSLKVLALAKQIASENEAELYVLHVCPSILVPLGGAITNKPAAEKDARDKLAQTAAKHLTDVAHELMVTSGDAAERVINAQSALNIDLIVMGTHGRRGVPRFFLGSVAERVVREAGCPVLTMRGE
ncbi:MAG TPA: universal stress protein [Candidatus Binataceae bacterium]|nr:universal stress protein [Candidatus Binataceae bacterium]